MRSNSPVEEKLQHLTARWRWLRVLQHSATLGGFIALGFLALGVSLIAGWTPAPTLVRALQTLLIAGGLVTWLVLVLSAWSSSPERSWLARGLERGQPAFLDRLNTLVFLENKGRRNPVLQAFRQRIAKQAQAVIVNHGAPVRLPAARLLLHLLGCAAALIVTLWVYERYEPWQRLLAARQLQQQLARTAPPTVEPPAPESPVPDANLVEHTQPWGEVRITEPGRDLQVTKVDVVPLQIEAAANEPLREVGWATTLNGSPENPRELPPPAEPKFAVYQPLLYLDELRLSDWDLLTYHARASTTASNDFASDVYFLEVRPFREDLLKLPGGEDGQAYQSLNELTALIDQQRHIIRQTHQHARRPPESANLAAQDRNKLASAEGDLAKAANHLYARMAAEMEKQPIGEALNQLAKAEKNLDGAGESLRSDQMGEAQNRERAALADLVAARKVFQKAVSENPDAFAEAEPAPTPRAAETDASLKAMAEFRNESKAARDFIEQAAKKQQDIARRAETALRAKHPALGGEERELLKSIEAFQQQHPQPFRDVAPETSAAAQSLAQAADALQRQRPMARTNAQDAARQLDRLNDALQSRNADRQLTDAYKLKQMLDRQITECGNCQKAGGNVSDAAVRGTASAAGDVLQQLKNTAEQSPTREAFGPELREALSDANMAELQQRLGELARAQGNEAKQEAAGQAKEALSRVSQAFEASQPGALQAAAQRDALKPAPGEGAQLGLAQLESLLRQLEHQRAPSPQDQARQGREALFNLQSGWREQFGSNERSRQLLVQLEELLDKKKGEQPVEAEDLRKLMQELQRFSVEVAGQRPDQRDQAEVTNLDPSRLPPAYRSRIEKYFQQLSEK